MHYTKCSVGISFRSYKVGSCISRRSSCIIKFCVSNIGSSVSVGAYQFTLYGNFTVNGTGNLNTTASSKLVIDDLGSKNQVALPSGVVNIQVLTIDRATGVISDHNIDLDDTPPVPGDSVVLVLTNGVLVFTGVSKLLLNHIDIQHKIPCSNTSYVDGVVSRAIKSGGGMYLFPLGDGGISRMYGMASGNPDAVHEVQFFKTEPPDACCVDDGWLPGNINLNYYWHQVKISGGQPQRRIYYEASDFPMLSAAQRIAALTLANNEVASITCSCVPAVIWGKPSSNYTVYDDVAKSVIKGFVQFDGSNASNNEYWTFGSTDASATLPVELMYFKGDVINTFVKLSWATASETNNDYFTVERSSDGITFEPLTKIGSSGNSNAVNYYEFTDSIPLPLVSYYRLKQTDFDGSYKYHNVITVYFQTNYAEQNLEIYPNPIINNNNIYLKLNSISEDLNIKISISDILGKVLYSNEVLFQAGKTNINILEIGKIPAGVYILNGKSKNINYSKKLIVY